MGFNLITTTGGLPDFLRELGGYQDEGLGAGIQARAPKLSVTTDKHFTITKEGATTILQEELTDGAGNKRIVPSGMVRCIIVASAQSLTKAWYEKGYVAGNTDAPDCYSNDGKVPTAGVAKPQCANCASCPRNAFGSDPVTGRGKACKDRKLIVVVWEGAPDELMTFNVPTMSLNSLQKLDSELRQANIPMQSVLVGLTFDPNVQYPVVKINALGFVDKETTLKWKEAAGSAEVMSLLREVEYDQPQQLPVSSPVPNNTINFGGGTPDGSGSSTVAAGGQDTNGQASVGETAAQGQAGTSDVAGAAQPAGNAADGQPKRTRRTKAQMEAARQAAANAGVDTTQPIDVDLAAAKQADAAYTAETGQSPVNVADDVDDEEAELLRQLAAKRAAREAAKAASATSAATTAPVTQQTAQTTEPVATTTSTTQQSAPQTVASGNVMDLLAKWKS